MWPWPLTFWLWSSTSSQSSYKPDTLPDGNHVKALKAIFSWAVYYKADQNRYLMPPTKQQGTKKCKTFTPSGRPKCSEDNLLDAGRGRGGGWATSGTSCTMFDAGSKSPSAYTTWLDDRFTYDTTLCVLCGFLKQLFSPHGFSNTTHAHAHRHNDRYLPGNLG